MAQLKCDPCRIRVDGPNPGFPFRGASCPQCGAALGVAEDLRAIVGYRAVRAWDDDCWVDEREGDARAVAQPVIDPTR